MATGKSAGDSSPPDGGRFLTTRRRFLLTGALAGGGVMGLADALDSDGELGSLWAGLASLSQAYNVAGNLWVGPDSAKADVAAESGRIYMATDIQRDYYGDGGTWEEYGYGTEANPGPPVYTEKTVTEQATVDGFLKGISVEILPFPSKTAAGGGPWPYVVMPGGQNNIGTRTTSDEGNYATDTVFVADESPNDRATVLGIDPDTQAREVLVSSPDYFSSRTGTEHARLIAKGRNPTDDSLFIFSLEGDMDAAGDDYTLKYFTSWSNFESDTVTASISNVGPSFAWQGHTLFNDNGTVSLLFAEYIDEADNASSSAKVYLINEDGSTAERLTISYNDIRHIHGIAQDPYNDGHMYVFTGDNGSDIRWYKDTSYGEGTWTEEIKQSDVSLDLGYDMVNTYRTLNIHFDRDYLYWVTDGPEGDGYTHLYRAPRSDLTDVDNLGRMWDGIDNDPVNLLVTRFNSPPGLFIFHHGNGASSGNWNLPFWWYDLQDEVLLKAGEMEIEAGETPVLRYGTPYQDAASGKAYFLLDGLTTRFSNNWAFSVDVSRLHRF